MASTRWADLLEEVETSTWADLPEDDSLPPTPVTSWPDTDIEYLDSDVPPVRLCLQDLLALPAPFINEGVSHRIMKARVNHQSVSRDREPDVISLNTGMGCSTVYSMVRRQLQLETNQGLMLIHGAGWNRRIVPASGPISLHLPLINPYTQGLKAELQLQTMIGGSGAGKRGHDSTEPAEIDWDQTFYEILGVPQDADRRTIKSAYLRMSTIYHPDKAGPEWTETQQRLNRIWEVLGNGDSRAEYDADPTSFAFSTGPPPEPAQPEPAQELPKGVCTTLVDYVDTGSLEFFASLKAASYVMLEGEDGVRETLRSRAFIELLRLEAAGSHTSQHGILVPYRYDNPSILTGVPGRMVGGVSDIDALDGIYYSGVVRRLVESGLSVWQATRPLHAGPKLFKEIARGCTRVLDADRKKSFPNAVLDRYLDLIAIFSL